MVLFLSLGIGTNKAFEHSERAGSDYALCYSEGVQNQYMNNNRKLYNEVPRRKQERTDPSPSNNNYSVFKGWSEGSLGRRRRGSFDITTPADRSEQGTPKPKEKGGVD